MSQQTTAEDSDGRAWAARWAARIGESVATHRRAAGLSARELSERCAELGYAISRGQIANLENGRKESVTVAEVEVLARALWVPPLLLMFPLGREQEVEAVPGASLPPWFAVQWWRGEGLPMRFDDDEGLPKGLPADWYSDADPALSGAPAISLFSEHERATYRLVDIRHTLRDPKRREQLLELVPAAEENAVQDLRNVRTLMLRWGLIPPPLPEGFLPGGDGVDGPTHTPRREWAPLPPPYLPGASLYRNVDERSQPKGSGDA